MAGDIAEIGFRADTDELADAKDKLDALSPAAKKAEIAADKLNKELANSNRFASLAAAGFGKATGAMKLFATGAIGFAAGIVSAFAFDKVIGSARLLSQTTAELATNVAKGTGTLERMTKAARSMADQFGTSTAAQVKTFYDAVSAGATSVAAATAIVDTANRLAIGGITDVASAVDVLTTTTNAYSASGLTALQASDALFIGMKAGKTTIGELSSSMGQIVPIASALGVGFDELVAGTAALTLSGLSTSSAVNGLRSVLSNVAKPSSQAQEMAKKLGIEFNAAGLKSKGLAGFLTDVIAKTGGSSESLALLFGDVEALNAVLAFAGAGGKNFNDILEQMKNKAGATGEAFSTIADSLDFRFGVVLIKLGNLATDFGMILLAVIVPVSEAIISLIDGSSTLIPILQEVGITLAIAFAPAILTILAAMIGSIASLAIGIGTGLVAAIYSAAAAMLAFTLSNPFTALLYAIPLVLAAIYVFRDNINKIFGIDIVAAVKTGANNIISTLVGTFKGVSAVWSQLPAAMSDVAVQAAQGVVNIFINMARSVVSIINGMIASINGAIRSSGIGTEIGDLGIPSKIIPEMRLSNSNAGAGRGVVDAFKSEMNNAFKTNWVGGFSSDMSEATDALTAGTAAAGGMAGAVDGIGSAAVGGGEGAKGGGGGAAKAMTELQSIAEEFTKLSEPFNQAASAFDAAQEALNNGIITNDEYAASLKRIQDAFIATGGTSDQWAKIINGNTDSVATQMKDLAKGALTQLGDEFINLLVDGKASFEELAKSIIKDLLRIAWQALIVKPLLGFFGFSGGGTFGGGAGSGSLGVGLYASGGTFTNSVVNRPTPFAFANGGALGVMGEAGPEAIMPLQRGADGSLGVQMYGGNSGGGNNSQSNNVEINNNFRLEGVVSEEKVTASIKAAGEQNKEEVKKSMVGWLNQYSTDGAF